MRDGTYLFFRNLKQKKQVYFLEFGIIFMVSVLFFSVCSAVLSNRASKLRLTKAAGEEHATFYGAVKELEEETARREGVALYCRFNMSDGFLLGRTRQLSTGVIWYETISEIPLPIEFTGKLPENAAEVLMPEQIRNLSGDTVEAGQTVLFSGEDGTVSGFIVTGFYHLPYEEELNVGLKLLSNGKEMNSFSAAAVVFEKEGKIARKCRRISEQIGAAEYRLNEARVSLFLQGRTKWKTALLFGIVGFLLLGASAVLLRSTMTIREKQINTEYAVLRSIGVRKGYLYRLAAVEAFWMGAVGGSAGSAAAFFLMKLALRLAGVDPGSTRSFRYEGGVPSLFAVLFCVLFLLLLTKTAQVRKVMSYSIREAFSGRQKSVVKKRSGKTYRNPEVAYLVTSMKRNKGRLLLCIASFSVSIFYFITMSALAKDIREATGYSESAEPYYDACISLNTGYSERISTEGLTEILKSFPAVAEAAVDPVYYRAVTNVDETFCPAGYATSYDVENGSYRRVHVAVYSEEELRMLANYMTAGSTDIGDGAGCILVNLACAVDEEGILDYTEKQPVSEKQVGDSISILNLAEIAKFTYELIHTEGYDSEKIKQYTEEMKAENRFLTLEIVGTVSSDLYFMDQYFPVVILSEAYYNSLLAGAETEGGRLKVKLAEGYGLRELRKACASYAEFGEIDYYDLNRSVRMSMDAMFGMMYGVVMIAALIGVVNVFCVVMLDWEVRKKEYAILRSVGAVKSRLIRMILIEKGAVCLCSVLLGAGLSVLAEKMLLKMYLRDVRISFTVPFAEIAAAAGAMLSVAVLAAVVQSALLRNKSISEMIQQSGES